jgi:hypothetical protein
MDGDQIDAERLDQRVVHHDLGLSVGDHRIHRRGGRLEAGEARAGRRGPQTQPCGKPLGEERPRGVGLRSWRRLPPGQLAPAAPRWG